MQVVEVLPAGDLLPRARALAKLPIVVGKVIGGEPITPDDPIVGSRHGTCLQNVELAQLVDLTDEGLVRDVLPNACSDDKIDAAFSGEPKQSLDQLPLWPLLPVIPEEHVSRMIFSTLTSLLT